MTTENGKREGRNWPEMTSSGGSVGKLGRTFVRFWGPAKRSCRPRLFSIPGQNLGQLTAGVIQIGPLFSRRFHTTESLCPSPRTLQQALTSTFVENQVEANFPPDPFKFQPHNNPHTPDDKLILPAVSEDVHTVLHKLAMDMIKKIPSSNTTVQR
ncbi:hypothetical protein T01_16103 [Trichinella spiralis]|uniref:Uncharacterized protein n=1 Tax=Trichinella spiralis TaxID=6334 RepID=A0A0V1C032_TRISP|nr:hypothetical protein T01_16103 [Trichinella spiralis]